MTDSPLTQPIVRPTRRFNTLKVPRKLQAALPFASKPKIQKAQTNKTCTFPSISPKNHLSNSRIDPLPSRVVSPDLQKRAVVLEPDDKRAISLLQQISAITKAKVAKRKEAKSVTKEKRKKKLDKADEGRADREKEDKKEHFRKQEGKAASASKRRKVG